MASSSKPSEFLNSVVGNTAPPPDDTSQIPGTEFNDIMAMQDARKRAIGSIRKQPRIRGPRKMSKDALTESSFPLLSENERKAP